jgi:hypothetical protein
MERHVALRARLKKQDPMALFFVVQKALTVLRLWSKSADAPSKRLRCIFQWALWRAWPRVCVVDVPSDDSRLPFRVVSASATAEEAKTAARWGVNWQSPEQGPPFQACLAPYDNSTCSGGSAPEKGAVIYLMVTHMLSDGFSLMPLLNDFADLVEHVERELNDAGDGPSPSGRPQSLPVIPNMFSVYEQRIRRTIDEDSSLRDEITAERIAYNTQGSRSADTLYANLPQETVLAIRDAARKLAVSNEIAILTGLGVTFARFEIQRTMPVHMIVPQRDEPASSEIVGLFADIRQFNICTDGLSVAGVALRLHRVVKERLWTPPGFMTLAEVPLINFEWTDLDARNGFAQMPQTGERPEMLMNPFKVSVDEPGGGCWRLRIVFDSHRYPETEQRRFIDILETTLRQLVYEPTALVWPQNHIN